jgi:hypothetical protein
MLLSFILMALAYVAIAIAGARLIGDRATQTA